MSNLCHICGPVKHQAPTVICMPCALSALIEEIQRTSPTLSIRALYETGRPLIKGAPL